MEKDPLSSNEVMVSMSGGVDSSVAAALLIEKGYRVSGIMMRTDDIRFLSDEKRKAEDGAENC